MLSDTDLALPEPIGAEPPPLTILDFLRQMELRPEQGEDLVEAAIQRIVAAGREARDQK
jgi:hypothetical protein